MIELKHLVTGWARKLRLMDFETLGRATRLECATREEAIECCACDVQSLEDHTQIETSKLKALIYWFHQRHGGLAFTGRMENGNDAHETPASRCWCATAPGRTGRWTLQRRRASSSKTGSASYPCRQGAQPCLFSIGIYRHRT